MSELGDADNPVRPRLGPRHPGRRRRHDHPGPLQQHRLPAPAVRARRATRSPRSSSSRSWATPRRSCRKPGFHQAMRALTEEFGILLIFDEVKTGFRLARGGAAEFFGITPDLATYAKAMGNGYPAAAFGGRREIMARAARQGQPRRHVRRQPGRRRGGGQDARDPPRHGRARHDPRDRPADPGRAPRGPQPDRPAVRTSPATRRCSGSCSPTRCPSEYRDWANTDHELYDAIAIGMMARGAMPEPDSPRALVHVRGARQGRHRRPGRDALRGVAPGRPRGSGQGQADRRDRATGAMATRRPAEPSTREEAATMALDGNAVRSVDRAAALLLALGESQGEAGVTELARRLGLHKSTASRLLATLQKRGLVEQDDETGKYRLGLVVIRLAERAERTLDLRGIAMPELERLARLTHETTGLGVLDGDSAADRRPGRRPEPHRGRRLDRARDAAPLRRVGQGAARLARRARGAADRPARPRDRTRSARSSSSSRSSRSWPGSGGAATPRRSASTSSGSTRSRPRSTTRAAT